MMEVYFIDHDIMGTCFLVKGEQAILFDPGMAFNGRRVVEKVKDILDGQSLDAVFLTHSHYDHVAAVPYIRLAWPDITVYAAEYACRIFQKPKAKKMMYDMSLTAAKAAGREWEDKENYRDDLLYGDVALHDGDVIEIGSATVKCVATIGHTQCSMSFLINGDVMISSETIGLEGDHESGYMPAFLISYKGTVESLERTKAANPKRLYLPHRGFVEPDERFWKYMSEGIKNTKQTILDILARYDSLDDQLKAMEDCFWRKTAKGSWPKEAFDINAAAMLKTMASEFSQELEELKH